MSKKVPSHYRGGVIAHWRPLLPPRAGAIAKPPALLVYMPLPFRFWPEAG
ncbi:MAG TPA: hypothetical protein VIX17_11330 [Pyrinomonadaceae bacterium]